MARLKRKTASVPLPDKADERADCVHWPWVQPIRSYVQQRDAERLHSEMGLGAADIAEIVPEIRRKLTDLEPPPNLILKKVPDDVDQETLLHGDVGQDVAFVRDTRAGEGINIAFTAPLQPGR